MATPVTIDTNQLVIALTSDAVLRAITAAIKPVISKVIEEAIAAKLVNLDSELTTIKSNIATKDRQINELKKQSERQKIQISQLERRYMDTQQHMKRNNLLINGLTVSYAEATAATDSDTNTTDGSASTRHVSHSTNLTNQVVTLFKNVLKVDVQPADITAHLAGTSKKGQLSPPVIVSFVRRTTRDEVYRNRRLLKNHATKIYINEDLTIDNAQVLKLARELYKNKAIQGCWSSNCRVYIKELSGAIKLIKSVTDLDSNDHFEL